MTPGRGPNRSQTFCKPGASVKLALGIASLVQSAGAAADTPAIAYACEMHAATSCRYRFEQSMCVVPPWRLPVAAATGNTAIANRGILSACLGAAVIHSMSCHCSIDCLIVLHNPLKAAKPRQRNSARDACSRAVAGRQFHFCKDICTRLPFEVPIFISSSG